MSQNTHFRAQRRHSFKTSKVAESTHSNEGGNNTAAANEQQPMEAPKARRAYKQSPLSGVLRKAKALFNRQLVQSGETKAKCIELALSRSSSLYPDPLRFWQAFKAERDRLLDSAKFNKACRDLSLEPAYVADHVLFEGKANIDKVLKEGLQVMGESVHMFKTPLWDDKFNLYGKVEPVEQEVRDE